MKIHASHCEQCTRTIIPPHDICPYCGKSAGIMTSLQIDSKGKILSYTTLEMPPNGFVPPLSMALVELDDGAVVLCLASDGERAELTIGARVTVDTDQENRYRFHVLS